MTKIKPQNVTTLKNSNHDKTQKLKILNRKLKVVQNLETQIVLELKNPNKDQIKNIHISLKLKNSNCNKTQILTKLKTQTLTKLKNSNRDQTQIVTKLK